MKKNEKEKSGSFVVREPISMDQVKSLYIQWVYDLMGGDKKKAAAAIGITPKTIYNYERDGKVNHVPRGRDGQ